MVLSLPLQRIYQGRPSRVPYPWLYDPILLQLYQLYGLCLLLKHGSSAAVSNGAPGWD